MSIQSGYRINAPHVISEVIDGEAIILNFENGSYYSLNESGMVVWQGIRDGQIQDQILVDLKQRFSEVSDELADDLSEILKTLEEEQLIVPIEEAPGTDTGDYEGEITPYMKPGLEKFTDLEELLLLDPIHDVDESGWPVQSA